ncbi:MAG TPA: beta-galactosidase [Longimicrobiales bacterium]|nr:beta-galactosidase [Longimicrobiales bacterium]
MDDRSQPALGVCYYPEHWPEATWADEAGRMADLGLRWVRVGEFAWSRLEPVPGELAFDWLDRALDTLGGAGLRVVLGTPTATPPKWLVDRYPEVLPVGRDGRVRGFGSRRHVCFTSPAYREETRRIVTLLAERYGRHEAVGAWQTDNEYGCHDTVRCYCPRCRAAFQHWLRARYGTVETLNEAWWTVFWSQEVRTFAEVELPGQAVTESNPSHTLDYYRFASDQVVAYNRLQVEILRAHSDRPVLHNVMGFFDGFDHFALARDLDAMAWDEYPLGMLEESPLPAALKERYLRVGQPDLMGFTHDLVRGLKDRPFWVMEMQPGSVNWARSNPQPAPGAVRLWSHQAFAHGAEVVSYFRWRAARGGQELMHAGLELHDGRFAPVAAEIREVAGELAPASGQRPRVALLFDYEDLWATDLQPHAEGWSYRALQLAFYSVLRGLGVDVAVAHPDADLAAYPLVVAPSLHLVGDERAARLRRFVDAGGRLLLGPRSGAKTPSNLAQAPSPGPLRPLSGVRIDRVDALRPGVQGTVDLGGTPYGYGIWADLLEPEDADTLARYYGPAYGGAAAVTRSTAGRGACVTLGAFAGPELLAAVLMPLLAEVGVDVLSMPEGVRRCQVGRGALLNFTEAVVEVGGVRVPAQGVAFADVNGA